MKYFLKLFLNGLYLFLYAVLCILYLLEAHVATRIEKVHQPCTIIDEQYDESAASVVSAAASVDYDGRAGLRACCGRCVVPHPCPMYFGCKTLLID